MAVLVTGASGQLGYDVVKDFESHGIKTYSPSHSEMDLLDEESLYMFFNGKKIDAVIHCAAYTKVDLAEEEKDLCMKINFTGTKNITD